MKLMSIIFCILWSSLAIAQLAKSYPHDIGIENDPDVLYVEKFDDGLGTIAARYDDVKNAAGMSLDSDVPPGSTEPYSLKLTNVGGQNTGGHLYKRFVPGFDSTVFLRYYAKYPSISKGYIHHESVWIGGYNPSLPWPYPRAGICGLGDTRISIAYEPIDQQKMNTYMYWGDMHHDPNGNCWGNLMIEGTAIQEPIPYDDWLCVEMMVKLNDPATAHNGELRIWQNEKEIGYWGPGFPKGSWTWDRFHASDTAQPFEGFQWRTDPNLNLNYIWIEYYDDQSPAGISHYVKYDHIVIARKRIGPIYDPNAGTELQSDKMITLYPNPVSNKLTLAGVLPGSHLRLINALGEEVFSSQLVEPKSEIDVSLLSKGIFFAELRFGGVSSVRKKIIKQ